MAIPGRKAQILVEAVDATKGAMDSVERNLASVNNAAAKLSGVLGKVFLATAAIEFGRKFTEAAIQAEQASNRLTAVLRATGHAAGLIKGDLDAMADSFAKSTQFDDESVREAQAVLLKFGNIQEEVFRRALKLAADYASFTGSAIPEAAQTIGKALVSPIEGTEMLERQIGKFNPVAEQMIKNFIAAGEHAKAQGVVLDVLAGKIGGTAEQMNTGLFQATKGTGKAWDELMESMGKSRIVSGPVNTLMREVETYLINIKDIIENGDWVEKTYALLALPVAGGVRRFNLTQPSNAGATEERARAAAAAARARGAGMVGPAFMDVRDLQARGTGQKEAYEWLARENEKAAREAKTAREKRMREDERAAQAYVDVEEEAAKDAAEAWHFYNLYRLAEEKKLADGQQAMQRTLVETAELMVQADEAMVYTWDKAGNRLEITRETFDTMQDDLKKNEAAARSLGSVFVWAAEESFRKWQGFGHLLKGIGQDIAMIIFRKGITEKLAGGITTWAESINWTSMFSGLFGGSRQGGGPVEAGRMYEVSEQGPELLSAGGRQYLMMGAQGGQVSAANSSSSGGNSYYIDARGADRTGLARLEALILRLHGSIEHRAVAAVADANVRGRRW